MKLLFSIFTVLFLMIVQLATASSMDVLLPNEPLPNKNKLVITKENKYSKLNPCYVSVTLNAFSGSYYCKSNNTMYNWTVQGVGNGYSASNCSLAFIQAEEEAHISETNQNNIQQAQAIAACGQ